MEESQQHRSPTGIETGMKRLQSAFPIVNEVVRRHLSLGILRQKQRALILRLLFMNTMSKQWIGATVRCEAKD